VFARVVVNYRCLKAATHWPWVAGVADPKNEVRIMGSKSVLLRTLVAASSAKLQAQKRRVWRAQLCTKVARPKGFELPLRSRP
jgi:hypothetical protein